MRFSRFLNRGCAAIGIFLTLLGAALADQEKVSLDQVPKAVLEAVKARFPKGELTGAEKDTADKKITYEVKLIDKKRKFEVIAAPDGKILAVEKVLEISELPKVITAVLDSDYPKAKIKKAEEVTIDEKITYEVVLITADMQTVKLMFDPKGKLLEPKK